MAEDTAAAEGPDDAATVTLDADVAPWEAKLQAAAAAVDGWAGKVTARFAAAAGAITTRTEAISAAVKAVREDADVTGDLAASVGAGLGGALGTLVGGPIGAAIGAGIGRQLGGAIGANIDFDAILKRFEDVTPLFKEQADEWADGWAGFKFSADRTWGEIRALLAGHPLDEMLSGDFDEVRQRFAGLAAEIAGKLEDLFAQALARIEDAIDGAVERFREPAAALANWLQGVGVQLGVVEEGTASWGDSIRDLEDAGKSALMAIATGAGYVTDALRIAAGAFLEVYVTPLLTGLSLIAEQLAMMVAAAREAAQLGGMGDVLDKAADQSRKAADRLADAAKKVGREGFALIEKGLRFEGAEEARKKLEELLKRGHELNALDDERRRKPPEEEEDPVVRAIGRGMATASAAVEGSREAMRSVVQSRAGVEDAQWRTAHAVEDLHKTAKDQLGEVRKVNEKLRRDEPVEAI